MPAAEAVVELESLLNDLSSQPGARHWVTGMLAWRYQDAQRRDDLRRSALATINDPYVVGQIADEMWALAAQSYADAEDWPQARALLQPMIDADCRPVTDPVRQLLAVALIKTEDYAAALKQFDRVCMVDAPEQLGWMRTALQVDCRLNGAPACVDRVIRYAAGAAPSEALQTMLNTALAQLATATDNRELLDQQVAKGLLTSEYRVIPQAPPMVAELKTRKAVVPQYPEEAGRKGQGGFVRLQLTVDPEGRVTEATVIDSSPPGVFDASALSAARMSRYHPKIVDGKPQQTEGQYSVFYSIGGNFKPEPFNRVQAAARGLRVAGSASAPDAHPSVPKCR
ncbi:MAG TPA: energy transducer TonB [Fontimonas sp.]